ncbi:hypothetical protein [Bacteroides sp. 51]|uniref:hypothetical protein n=1 Tax=Bacteroides sp. 51 TaxID=2302938 RepID=UPI0013D43172|nr:hypothetical protein [Bacteroides sp. 51]
MEDIKTIEFEIERLKARMLQFDRTVKVLEIPKEEAEQRRNEMLDRMSELLKQRDKLKE